MDRGELVPDHLIFEMLMHRLHGVDCNRGFILDGFPRNLAQAEWLNGLLRDDFFRQNCKLSPIVISIAVDYNSLLQRLTGRRSCPSCGRIYNVYTQPPTVPGLCDFDGSKLVMRRDDTEEVISERLKAYERMTLPLKEYYRAQNRLVELNGDQPPDQVTTQTFRAVERNGNSL
jgi:adenylate kinase